MIAHPTFRTRLYLLGRRLKTRGPQGMARYYLGQLNTRMQGRRDEQTDEQADRVEPSLTRAGGDFHSRNARWGVHYGPSREDVFAKASRHLKTVVESWDEPDWEFCIYRSVG